MPTSIILIVLNAALELNPKVHLTLYLINNMNSENITLSYSLYSNKGVFALFIGSGISRNAGIPTGWEIIIDHLKQLAALEDPAVTSDFEEWYSNKYGCSPDYSDLLELLTSSKSERNNALRRFFEPSEEELINGLKQPTKAHRNIAKLVKKGYIKVIVTTNFDRLMENALKNEGIEPVVISNPNHIDNVQPIVHNKITLIKMNGDYLDTEFLNLKSELSGYQPAMEELLKSVFQNFGLITCGWSAIWDHALVTMLKSSNKFRYSNYFTYTSTPSAELKDIAAFRGGKLLKIIGADEFLVELNENIDALEKVNDEHPLNESIAIARLKKLLAKDDFRIDLNDFVAIEADQLFTYYTNWPHPTSNEVNLKAAIEMSFSKNQTLNKLLANGVYWGKTSHHSLWVKVITKFLHPRQRSQYIGVWIHFDHFPALQLMYIAGISAILNEDFVFLNKLFSIYRPDPYYKGDTHILDILNPPKVLEPKYIKAAFNNTYYNPFSELFFQQLSPIFDDFIASEEDYINAFDYFEYIICLMHVKHVNEYPPYGRFAYRRRELQGKSNITFKKVEEAKIKNDDFELIAFSLIKDSDEYLALNAKIEASLSNMYFH